MDNKKPHVPMHQTDLDLAILATAQRQIRLQSDNLQTNPISYAYIKGALEKNRQNILEIQDETVSCNTVLVIQYIDEASDALARMPNEINSLLPSLGAFVAAMEKCQKELAITRDILGAQPT